MAAGDNATTFYGYDSAFGAAAASSQSSAFLRWVNQEWEDFLQPYEYMDEAQGAILRNNPAIRKVFNDGLMNVITPEVRDAKIEQILGRRSGGPGSGGPSTAQRAANITAEIRNIARMFGLPDQDFNALGWQAANNNWDIEQIRDLLADQITYETTKNPGYVNDIMSKTRSYASDYMVRVSDEEALSFAKQVASGDLDPESIKTEMGRRAKAQYSYLSHVIDGGGTLKEYFDPHRKTIAQLMEVAPDKIDFLNDPQWSNVINRPPDSNDTTRREMTLSETEAFVRSKDQWSTTQNARSTAANGAAAIAKALGAL
jgi:hypothetical protein